MDSGDKNSLLGQSFLLPSYNTAQNNHIFISHLTLFNNKEPYILSIIIILRNISKRWYNNHSRSYYNGIPMN